MAIIHFVIYPICLIIIGLLLFLLFSCKKKYREYKIRYNSFKKAYEDIIPPNKLLHGAKDNWSTYVQQLQAVENYGKLVVSIIPKNYEIISNYFSDFFIFDKPKKNDTGNDTGNNIGSDFFLVEKVGEIIIFGVFDSPDYYGVGLYSKLFVRLLILQSINELNGKIESSKILEITDRRLIELVKDKRENDHAMSFDCALCCYDTKTNQFTFSGSYLPLYHISNNQLTKIGYSKKSIGNYRIDSQFEKNEIPIQKGDFIYLATDGYENQFGGIDKKQYKNKYRDALNISKIEGKNSFDDLVLDLCKLEMSEQTSKLNSELDNWKNQKDELFEQFDDILIVGLKI